MGVSPPHSSGSSPFSLISCFTLSILAPSLSICRNHTSGTQPKSAGSTAAPQSAVTLPAVTATIYHCL